MYVLYMNATSCALKQLNLFFTLCDLQCQNGSLLNFYSTVFSFHHASFRFIHGHFAYATFGLTSFGQNLSSTVQLFLPFIAVFIV